MPFSIIRLITGSVGWTAFGIGTLLNVILIQLVRYHTPKPMQIYSKILLQTCITDILLLVVTILFYPLTFVSYAGIAQAVSGGLIKFHGPENRYWALASYILWIFLVYVSMFGYVAQFIYRYLILNWSKHLSSTYYFLLFAVTLAFPLAYCILLVPCYLSSPDQALMDDTVVAQMLALNISEQITLSGYSPRSWLVSLGFCYIIAFCTLAYVIMFTLGWLMHRFLRNRSKLGATSKMNKKTIEMNKQITRNLLIQATMPFLIFLSMLFKLSILLFKIDVSSWWWLQYFNLLANIPMYLPSAINPLVTILIIRYYRRALLAGIGHLVNRFRLLGLAVCCQEFPPQGQEQQQQRAADRWAQSTVSFTVKSKNIAPVNVLEMAPNTKTG